ncbi:hypothetical protein RUND412_007776 [Rhizina undulata]
MGISLFPRRQHLFREALNPRVSTRHIAASNYRLLQIKKRLYFKTLFPRALVAFNRLFDKMGSKKRKNRSNHYEGPVKRAEGKYAKDKSPSPFPPLPVISVPQFQLTYSGSALAGTAIQTTTQNTAVAMSAALPSSVDEGGEWEEVTRNKKAKKGKSSRDRNYPEFAISPTKLRKTVHLGDLQGLVMWLVADGVAPQWLLVRHKPEIRKVVVLMVPGLTMDMFDGTTDLHPKSAPEIEDEDLGIMISRASDGGPEDLDSDGPEIPVAAKNNTEETENFFPIPLEKSKLAPCLHPFAEVFTHIWPIKCTGDYRQNKLHSPIGSFLNSAVPKNVNVNPGRSAGSQKRVRVSQLLMTLPELIENEYPLHSSQLEERRRGLGLEETEEDRAEFERKKAEGWVETDLSKGNGKDKNEGGSVTEGMTIYSIDCEMCRTSEGLELARISVLGWDGNTVYDTLVKPEREITDYLTNYSGMTQCILDPVTTTLADVQSHLLTLLNNDTILLGQSLNSDLNALKLCHPHIVDTSVIYDHPRGNPYKPSLKWLSQKFLKREIQSLLSRPLPSSSSSVVTSPHGHDSIEDAKACLDLLKLKIENGMSFGTIEAQTEPIFKRFSRMNPPKKGAVVDYGNPERWYGTHANRTITVHEDREVVKGVQACVAGDAYGTGNGHPKMDFVWGRFRSIEILRGWTSDSDPNTEEKDKNGAPSELLPERVADVAGYVKSIYDSLPNCTALVVYSGTGDPRELRRLQEMQKIWKEEYKFKKWDDLSVKWTDTEEQLLKNAVVTARLGVGFLVVK